MTEWTIHHVGLACTSIVQERHALQPLGAIDDGPMFEDPGLGIRGRFVRLGSARIELLEEIETSGVLAPWLKGGSRLYHLAYTVSDLDGALASTRGARLVRGPLPAVAFDGRRVAFLMTPTLLLLELIES
jgi:methylmalonyl-CoA/ethylmalonyl-CoA epimerase